MGYQHIEPDPLTIIRAQTAGEGSAIGTRAAVPSGITSSAPHSKHPGNADKPGEQASTNGTACYTVGEGPKHT